MFSFLMFLLLLRGRFLPDVTSLLFFFCIEFYIGGSPAGRVADRVAASALSSELGAVPIVRASANRHDNGRPQPRCLLSESGGSSIPRRGHATRLRRTPTALNMETLHLCVLVMSLRDDRRWLTYPLFDLDMPCVRPVHSVPLDRCDKVFPRPAICRAPSPEHALENDLTLPPPPSPPDI